MVNKLPFVDHRVTCCDTSFLFALYGSDRHSPRALALAGELSEPITLTVLNGYELTNALHLAEWRKLLAPGKAVAYLRDLHADISQGKLVLTPCNLAAVVREAGRLSDAHTPQGGYRSFDILHVAAARVLGAAEFLSFDDKQRALATAIGLNVRL